MKENLRNEEQECIRNSFPMAKRQFLIDEKLTVTDLWRSRFEGKRLISDFGFNFLIFFSFFVQIVNCLFITAN